MKRGPRSVFAWVDRAVGDLAGVALVAIMLLTAISTFGRYLFSRPVPDGEAITEMLLVAVVLLPLAYAQTLREHVSVTVFTDMLGWRSLLWLERLGLLIGVLSFGFLAYALGLGALRAYNTNDAYLGVNLILTWPARAIAAVGIGVFTIRLAVDLVTVGRFTGPEDDEESPSAPVSDGPRSTDHGAG